MLFWVGKALSGFHGLAHAQCGRFRFSPQHANIAHETDRLSITYHLSSSDEFYTHLRENAKSASQMSLRSHASCRIKSFETFDDFAPEHLLDEANAQSRLDVLDAPEQRGKHYWPEIEIKTAFRWLRRADTEIGAPLLDAALSRKSTLSLPSGRANIPLPPSRMQLDAASAQAAPEIALSAGAAPHKLRAGKADLAKQFAPAKPADVAETEILITLETLGRTRRAGEGKFGT